MRAPLGGDQPGEMRAVFGAQAAVIAARVARDLGGAVEHADRLLRGDEGERWPTSVCGIE
jgi:hypothetical protein